MRSEKSGAVSGLRVTNIAHYCVDIARESRHACSRAPRMIPLINVMNFTFLTEQAWRFYYPECLAQRSRSPEVTINNATRQRGDILVRAAANRKEIPGVMEKNGRILPGKTVEGKEPTLALLSFRKQFQLQNVPFCRHFKKNDMSFLRGTILNMHAVTCTYDQK